MGTEGAFPLLNDLTEGKLGEHIITWRADGLRLIDVRNRLQDEYGIDVSIETVRRWIVKASAA